jgi:hypothetical protein
MGVIQSEVLAVLDQAESAMGPREIHEAVEQRLGRRVSYDTVSRLPLGRRT